MDIKELIGVLNALNKPVTFTGDGIPVFEEAIKEGMEVEFQFAPAHMNRQRAAAVATLGGVYFRQGIMEMASEHSPIYLRKSQAEREREERMENTNK